MSEPYHTTVAALSSANLENWMKKSQNSKKVRNLQQKRPLCFLEMSLFGSKQQRSETEREREREREIKQTYRLAPIHKISQLQKFLLGQNKPSQKLSRSENFLCC